MGNGAAALGHFVVRERANHTLRLCDPDYVRSRSALGAKKLLRGRMETCG